MTYKDHAYCTYDGEHRFRKNPSDIFDYHVGQIEREPMSFVHECKKSAELIRGSTSLPITVLYSGGIDSEIVMESFRTTKIEIRAAFCKYENNYNGHDFEYAQEYCNGHGIPLDIVDLNLMKFWDQEVYDYASLAGCLSPQLNVIMWLMEQLDGYLVAATGDVEFRRDHDRIWRYAINEGGDCSWNRFVELKGMDVVPCFPEYTPEQLLANLELPYLKRLALGEIDYENSTICSKPAIYENTFDFKQRPKFSGFEKVLDRDAIIRKKLHKELGMYDNTVRWTWHEYKEKLHVKE